MDAQAIATALEALSDPQVQRKRRGEIRPLRGIRGVPERELSRFVGRVWEESKPTLGRDTLALQALFGAAWEDGIVAIGLGAAAALEDPASGLELGMDWLGRIDDVQTADALGWLLLAPSALATDRFEPVLEASGRHNHPAARRAAVMMGMALVPTPIQGPAAAGLRAALGTDEGQIVDQPRAAELHLVADTFARDDDPSIRKGLRRVLGAWTAFEPEVVERWMDTFPGGVHRMFREEIESTAHKVRMKQKRRQRSAEP